MEDVNELARMSSEDKIVISNALETNPQLSLPEANESVQSQEDESSNSDPNATQDADEGDKKDSGVVSGNNDKKRKSLKATLSEIKKRQEQDRRELADIALDADIKDEDLEDIPNMIETSKEMIEETKGLISEMEKIQAKTARQQQ